MRGLSSGAADAPDAVSLTWAIFTHVYFCIMLGQTPLGSIFPVLVWLVVKGCIVQVEAGSLDCLSQKTCAFFAFMI